MGKNDEVTYLSIPSWDEHQEKRTNAKGHVWRPPWIKVKCDNSDDYAYSKLTLRQRGLLVEMWKLAGRLGNQIPYEARWLEHSMLLNEELNGDLEVLISRGFITSSVKAT